MDYKALKHRVEQRKVLTRHIVEQAEAYGYRCPATQQQLNAFRSVLIKIHAPEPYFTVVDGFAYDCANEDGTMRDILRGPHRVEVIDGRAL